MLTVQRIDDTEFYICNWCKNSFNIRDGVIARGNVYFCSGKCVLDYDRYLKGE